MAQKIRTHLPHNEDQPVEGMPPVPKKLTKQEFGRRLSGYIRSRNWSQSELSRRSGVPRDAISTYIRGTSLPQPENLARLASAFGIATETLLPNHVQSAIDADEPAFEMKVSPGAPNVAWVRVNQLVSVTTAVKIAEILGAERVTLDGKRDGRAAPVQSAEGETS